MADYTLNNSRNYTILTDQSGSTLYDSGGPTSSYGNSENFYVLIAPQYATGTLTLNLTSFRSETGYDTLRIYNDIPPTSSYPYTDTVLSSYCIGFFTGISVTVPQTITSSTGKAYIRWNSDGSITDTGFALSWTGSGFYTVDSSSNIPNNKYGITFPKDAASGSWMTFAPGKFTSSATLPKDRDIIIGFWAKQDPLPASAPIAPVLGIGTYNGGQGITIARSSSPTIGNNTLTAFYYDESGSISTTTTRATDIFNGGLLSADTYPPQWHYYGVVIRKTNATTAGEFRAYRDGVLFSSASITKATNWGSISTTYDTVLGNLRDSASGLILSGGATIGGWSGSLDDVFVATVITGASTSSYNTFFSRMYNSGNWADPNVEITGAFTSSYSPIVVANWRFEETGSILNTKDYGYYGNFHTASATGNIASSNVRLTTTASGVSYTPYSSIYYLIVATGSTNSFLYTSSIEFYPQYTNNYVIELYKNLSLGYDRNTQQVPFSLNRKNTGRIRNK